MTITSAVILAVIAGALHWKRRVPRFVAWVLLFVGAGAATVIVRFLGGFANVSLFGVGVFTLFAIGGVIVFWEEAVKRNGLHRVRTPIVAVILGVALMGVGGTFGAQIRGLIQTSGANLDQAVTTSFNK